jgi:peptidoglycan/LPS O-acetylase OafA/YrhL
MSVNIKYQGLEVVRAIAALVVVYNHIFTFGLIPKHELLVLPAQYATEAVMIFFVLSGVVVTLSVERRRAKCKTFVELATKYLKARVLRIYPIFILGLLLAVIAEKLIKGTWTDPTLIAGNALFLQSLQGYIVNVPQYNMPLWSLSYEMFYYLLFAACLLWGQFLMIWFGAALFATLFCPPSPTGGAASHLLSVLGLSIPWLMGHVIVQREAKLPRIPLSFGVACLVIGLVYARCSITGDYYDIFRLTSFALCCCPLLAAIIQKDNACDFSEKLFLFVRIVLAGIALVLLWTISPSLWLVKVSLTMAAMLAALLPLSYIDKCLSKFRWMLPGLVYIGSISYAIYAIHVPIIALTLYVGREWGGGLKIVSFSVGVLAISYIMERLVQPLLSMQRTTYATPP